MINKDLLNNIKDEAGAAIAMILVALVAILSCIAFAVDYHLAMTARDQASYLAGTCVTAALDEYFQPQASGTLQQRYENALNRCQSGANYGLDQGKIGGASSAELQVKGDSSSTGVKLEVGTWAKDANSSSMKFTPTLSSNITETNFTSLNSMRVSGIIPGGYLTNFAKNILGANTVPLSISAVASVVPRRGCFLVDVSGSMTSDSHPRDQGLFAFSVEQVLTPGHEANILWNNLPKYRNAMDKSPNNFYRSDYILMSTIGDGADNGFRSDGAVFEHSPTPDKLRFTRGPGQSNDKAVDFNIRDSSGVSTGTASRSSVYLVDAPRIAGVFGPTTFVPRYPEPLRSVFSAIHQAMYMYQNQRVAGDQACLIVYDANIDWARTIDLTSDFEFLESLTDFDAQYLQFRTDYDNRRLGITALNDANTLALLNAAIADPTSLTPKPDSTINEGNIFLRGMFPSALGFSDTAAASQEALNQFLGVDQTGVAHPPSITTADYVVMIGDGLGNCVPCSDASEDANSTCASSVGSDPATPRCLDSIIYNNTVLAQLDAQVRQDIYGYQYRKAQIHIMPIGNSIMPHTLDMHAFKGLASDGSCQLDTNSCMSDKDFRTMVNDNFSTFTKCYSYVNDMSSTIGHSGKWQFSGGSYESLFQDKDAKHPYYIINAFIYRLAAATGGLWAPVRPLDTNLCQTGRTDCVIDDFGNKDPNCSPTWVPKCGDAVSELYCYSPGAGATCTPGEKDLEIPYMRSNDPFCRTPREQMISYMKDILALRPISLGQVR